MMDEQIEEDYYNRNESDDQPGTTIKYEKIHHIRRPSSNMSSSQGSENHPEGGATHLPQRKSVFDVS